MKAFNRLALHEEMTSPNKIKLHWIILPATPDDIHDLTGRYKELKEEDIHMFY